MAKAMDAILLDEEDEKKKREASASESQPSGDATTDSPSEGDEPPRHVKSKQGLGCFAKLFLLALLGILAVCVTFFVSRYQSKSRFNARLSELAEAGTPVLLEDVELLYQIPERSLDATEDWMSVVKTIGSRNYQMAISNMDMVLWQQLPAWPPQSWNGSELSADFIVDYQSLITNLQLATMEYARFKFDPYERPVLHARRIQRLTEGYDLLERACYVAARQGKRDQVADLLTCCLGYYRCLQLHPEHQSEQLELRRRGLMTLLSAIESIEFRPKDLQRFRKQVENFDAWQPVHRAWNLHRTMLVAFYNEPNAFKETKLGQVFASDANWADYEKFHRSHQNFSPFPGHDGLKFLDYMDQVQAMFEGNPLTKAAEIVELQMRIAEEQPTGLAAYRHPTAFEMVPNVDELVQLTGQVAAIQQVALGALAFDYKRIESAEKTLIKDPAKASEGFLASEPIDLYTGFPLTVKLNNNELMILSAGPNKANDKLSGDDIGIRLSLEKWDFQ